MTRDEFRNRLRLIAKETTEDDVLQAVEEVQNGWDELETAHTELTTERDKLKNDYLGLQDRYRKRFWDGDVSTAENVKSRYAEEVREEGEVKSFEELAREMIEGGNK